MLAVTIVTNDAKQLQLQVSPVIIGITDYLEVPQEVYWSEKTERELSAELKAGVLVLDDHLTAIYIERLSEKDRPTEHVIRKLTKTFGVSRDEIEVKDTSIFA